MPNSKQTPTSLADATGALQAGKGLGSGQYRNSLYLFIVLSIAAVMVADIYTQLGVAVWIFYLVPVTLTLVLWNPMAPLYVAVVATVLMIYSFATDASGINRDVAQLNRGFGIFTIWTMAMVGYLFIRNRIAVQRQQWLQSVRAGLSTVVSGEQSPQQFASNVLSYLCALLDAKAAAFYVGNELAFERTATQGVPESSAVPEAFAVGEGLMGQAAKEARIVSLADVPEGYLRIGSTLGQSLPRHLVIAPMVAEGHTNAVLEFGFLQPADERVLEVLQYISEPLSIAVRSAKYRAHLQNLLEETQRQAEELQVQSEELRVANEEMEEQSRALQVSQAQLEQQQLELEESNSQLEEQTQILEAQRDDLARSRLDTEAKAREVERASQYKSDFLANMSHELRTPLNSSLILAQLLADNPLGNLTDDQVTSAKTIHAAGNDLLNLINDILDLSKIEAGRMDLRPETVWLAQLVKDLSNTLRPLAEQKGLEFRTAIAAGCPDSIDTDRQRLEQVLKNLLSNAIKFTDRGSVTLSIGTNGEGRVNFEVRDTGIGIGQEQQELIWQAFRQIDSAANRKYSGTGLGLSISRELTRLLGGTISVESKVGQGSAFTVTLPPSLDLVVAPIAYPESIPAMPAEATLDAPTTLTPTPRRFKDDREVLTGDSRIILLVEDDEPFAKILFDLAHELDFKCLVAPTAQEALALTRQYLPSAVVLDVGLPDHSGLTVLDRLKNDSRTRHIPVHVISANDHAESALALGAVGYMLKPVTREKLVDTLKGLETRLIQRMRRVLVVEDDAVQLDSMQKLLGTHDVQTVGVGTAADCLARLRNETFDCMVLDLSLPDASGYSLLETLSREDAYSFPPVIVYTGRDLSADEEHRLRRYSKSIIIKGAKSPERLLDEVTLFLHQVVSELPPEQQKMIEKARSREAALEGRRILVVEDDVRNVFALTSILEPRGAIVEIARNGREGIERLEQATPETPIDLVLMDVMMPEMDGITATREIRKRPEWQKLPIIMLTAKAMKDDQENCLAAGANDYMAKPLEIDKLLSLVRVWIRR